MEKIALLMAFNYMLLYSFSKKSKHSFLNKIITDMCSRLLRVKRE